MSTSVEPFYGQVGSTYGQSAVRAYFIVVPVILYVTSCGGQQWSEGSDKCKSLGLFTPISPRPYFYIHLCDIPNSHLVCC